MREGLLYELAHAIMEAEKSHDMLSASWRTRRVRGIIQPESKGLRTRSFNDWGQEKMEVPAQEESEFTLPPPLCSIQVLNGLDDARPHWGGQIS